MASGESSYSSRLLLALNRQRSIGCGLCDVTIVVRDALFRAHRCVLAACSGFFRSMLLLRDNLIGLEPSIVTPTLFQQVLNFIYTGHLPSPHVSSQDLSELLRAASYLQLSELASVCRRKLRQYHKSNHLNTSISSVHSNMNGHLRFNQSSYNTGTTEAEKGQKQVENLSEEEVFNSQHIYSTTEVEMEMNQCVTRPNQSSSTVNSSTNSSSNSLDDTAFNCTSDFTSATLFDHGEKWNSTKCSKTTEEEEERRRTGACREQGRSVQTKTLVRNGDLLQTCEDWGNAVEDVNVCQKNFSFIYHPKQPPYDTQDSPYVYVPCAKGPDVTQRDVDSLYVCVPCAKGFPSSDQLIAHVHSHTVQGQRGRTQEDSDKGVGLSIQPGGHPTENLPPRPIKKHKKEEAAADLLPPSCLICSVCGKTFSDVALLKHHERSHGLKRPFRCEVCGKGFTQRGTMKRHSRGHLGTKPYECEVCGVRFTRHYRKMEHMQIHARQEQRTGAYRPTF